MDNLRPKTKELDALIISLASQSSSYDPLLHLMYYLQLSYIDHL